MQTRRDQVQAHQFVVSRLTTGLLRADPDAPETPNRRTNRGVAIGAVLGVLISLGFLIFGFLRPGGATAWRDGGTMIVEKDTGTRYLYDGKLRPVLNYASARLIVGSAMKTENVSAASLAGTPHGAPVGIQDAPDSLPSPGDLDPGPWEVCAGTEVSAGGARRSTTSLVVGSEERGAFVPEAVLVRDTGDGYYLVWHGTRFRFASGSTTADALGYGASEPLRVSAAFLDALPAGPDLAPPAVAGQGAEGPELDGESTRTGQVFVVQPPGAARQYYLLQHAGLVPLTTTQAALALSAPGSREKAYRGRTPAALPLSTDALGTARAPQGGSGEARAVRVAGAALPAAPPKVVRVSDDSSACARLTPKGAEGTVVSLVLVDSVSVTASSVQPPRALAPACLAVDAVSVPPSGGSLVRALGSAGGAVGDTTYLVADTGVKYRIPTEASAQALGYRMSSAVALPSQLLAMLATGPDLSQEAAAAGRSTVTAGPACPAGPGAGEEPVQGAGKLTAPGAGKEPGR